ncbi:hypothetical protein EDD65_11816 [Keratinibaculum paraultunense]|uniref:Uncharacterized protein n=1 Tax=Keratinibaculum paraultunense TaxID=1278232 RepID=A0A4R3KND0_9FIRM|nr:hypothetical protein [Keratinibaculum paraultunense]QQY79078.1 hypothetical protein JL105_07750 [Keratinibaculum paraultunense]TCS85800.1 hypothetical protein EDD65_11816 [Keratinibaculum paraultunense]
MTYSFAKNEIKKYVGEGSLEIKYNFKNNSYYTVDRGYTISYDFNKKTIFDEKLSSDLNDQANALYFEFLENIKNVGFPESIYLLTEVNAEDYKKREQKIYILNIYEQKNFDNEKEIKDRMLELTFDLIEFLGGILI